MISEIDVWDPVNGLRTFTREQYIAEFGDAELREMEERPPTTGTVPKDDQLFSDKMQDQHATNVALAAAGITNLDDLPHESDDDTWTPPDDWPEPREYDIEGALADWNARGDNSDV